MKCPVCGEEAETLSMITGIYEPCGHSKLSKREQIENLKILRGVNKVAKEVLKDK